MIYLFTGRRGSLSPLLAACIYLQKDIDEYITAENICYGQEGFPNFIGFDEKGNRVYVMEARNYQLLPVICRELEKVAGRDEETVKVVPVEIKGEKMMGFIYRIGRKTGFSGFCRFLLKKWAGGKEEEVKGQI